MFKPLNPTERKLVEFETDCIIDFQFLMTDKMREMEITFEELSKKTGIKLGRLKNFQNSEANPTYKEVVTVLFFLNATLLFFLNKKTTDKDISNETIVTEIVDTLEDYAILGAGKCTIGKPLFVRAKEVLGIYWKSKEVKENA